MLIQNLKSNGIIDHEAYMFVMENTNYQDIESASNRVMFGLTDIKLYLGEDN